MNQGLWSAGTQRSGCLRLLRRVKETSEILRSEFESWPFACCVSSSVSSCVCLNKERPAQQGFG